MTQVDHTPPPPSLIGKIKALEPGQSLLLTDGETLNSVRSTVTRVKKDTEGSEFTTREADGGVRVWRLK